MLASYSCRADSHGQFLTPDLIETHHDDDELNKSASSWSHIIRSARKPFPRLWERRAAYIKRHWRCLYCWKDFWVDGYTSRRETWLQISRVTCNFVIAAALLVHVCARIRVDSGHIPIYVFDCSPATGLRAIARGFLGICTWSRSHRFISR